MASTLQLVTLPGRRVDLGIEAGSVLGVELEREWGEASPLDLGARFGWEQASHEGEGFARVLRVSSRFGEVPVRSSGQVGLRAASARGVFELPPEVLCGELAVALAGVILDEGQRPVLLLQAEGLWQLFERMERGAT